MASVSLKRCSYESDIGDVSGARAKLRDQVRNLGKHDRKYNKIQNQQSLDDITLPPLALVIGVLSQYDIAMVVDFLSGRGSAGHTTCVKHSLPILTAWVEKCIADIPVDRLCDLLELRDLSAGAAKKVHVRLVTACKYVVEHRLFLWTRDQNCAKGVAPGREQLTQVALKSIPPESPAEVIDDVRRPLLGSPRTQRKWLSSYRRRWGARIGKLQPREHLEPIVIKSKAHVQYIYTK
jgi:hypothetical protein